MSEDEKIRLEEQSIKVSDTEMQDTPVASSKMHQEYDAMYVDETYTPWWNLPPLKLKPERTGSMKLFTVTPKDVTKKVDFETTESIFKVS